MTQPIILLDWIDRARDAVSTERGRATRSGKIAARHEDLATTGPPMLRRFHVRAAAANRELQTRHLVAAGIHAAHLARLRTSVRAVMFAPPPDQATLSPWSNPALDDGQGGGDTGRDALTNLPNRRFLAARLAVATGAGDPQPGGAHRRLGVFAIGLDNLQAVADRFGPDVGDRVLAAVAHRLTERMRGRFLARFARDEFVLLLEDMGSWDDATKGADLVLAAISEPLHIDAHVIVLTASIGVVQRLVAESEPGELLRDAYTSLGWVQSEGGGHWAVFDRQRNDRAIARSALAADLPAAIEAGEMVLEYQPIISLVDGDMVGAEALVRWRHPELGLLLPEEFLDLAVQTGMIARLDRHVLLQACTEAMRWQEMRSDPPVVNVNVTPGQLRDTDIVRDVAEVLSRTGLPPSRLTVEITEGSIVEPDDQSATTLDRLVGLGVSIAIDDFGTGYSNLSYLRRLPVRTIKIDRAFLADLRPDGEAPDDASAEILVAIVSLAHVLGLTVVAEGVETTTQAAWLKSIGADLAQGWYFGRPVDAEQIEKAIVAGTRPGRSA